MIVLNATTDTIKVKLAGAITTNQLPCLSVYRDITTTAYTAGRVVTNTNSTTDVSLVTAPASNTQRVIDYLSVYNNDTVNATVTVKFDANATQYILFNTILGVGEKLEYTSDSGFKVVTNAGSVKTSVNQGNNAATNGMSIAVLGADQTNNNAVANTIQDVTGLSFAVTANLKYYFKFIIPYTSAATTTGCRFTINGPAQNFLYFESRYCLTATTETVNYCSAYDTPAASNASSLATGNVAIIEGFITPTANGTVIARFASEVLSSAIVAKAGATVYYQAIA
jgi:hypothetical protein